MKYLWTWLAATLGVLALVALVNVVIDPYDVFGAVSWDGVNRVKVRAGQRAELFKRSRAQRSAPRTMILGNSRAEIGFDPESPAWPATARPVFNFALPGAGIEGALDDFPTLPGLAGVRLVVVGLEFLDFRVDPITKPASKVASLDAPVRWRQWLSAALTVDALLDAIATVMAQNDPFATRLTDAGFNPVHEYTGIARNEGYHAMFRQRELENAKAYVRGPTGIKTADGRFAPEFGAVARFLGVAARGRAAVRFVIYPYHARTLVLFHQASLWPAFESWKRELVNVIEAAPTGADVELWDFSGFSPYADEAVPPPGDLSSEMRWYWEGGHFKKTLGDVLLHRLFDGNAGSDGWGRRLDGRNLEGHLSRIRIARDVYESAHPQDVAALAALVGKARLDKSGQGAAAE